MNKIDRIYGWKKQILIPERNKKLIKPTKKKTEWGFSLDVKIP